jgi:hypothetical protein
MGRPERYYISAALLMEWTERPWARWGHRRWPAFGAGRGRERAMGDEHDKVTTEAQHRARAGRLAARADAPAIESEIVIFLARRIITIDWAIGEIALFEDNVIPFAFR